MTAVVSAVGVLVFGAAALPPASFAATGPEVRADLVATRASIQIAVELLDDLLRDDSQVLASRIRALRAGVTDVSEALDRRPTEREMADLAARAERLRSGAARMVTGARVVRGSTAHVIGARQQAVRLLATWESGDLATDRYVRLRTAWANVAAHAVADRRAGLRSIAVGQEPRRALAPRAAGQARAGVIPDPVRDLTSVAGGCALPRADVGEWLGRATGEGITLWTNAAQVGQHRADLAVALRTRGALLGSEHRSITRRADAELGDPFDARNPNAATTRALRVGYAWLATGDEGYARVLLQSAEAMLDRTPEFYRLGEITPANTRLDDAKIMVAAATILDWLPDSARVSQLREVLAVRWLAAYSCYLAFDDNMMFNALNKSVIADSAAATTALAVAPDRAAEAAAIVRAAVTAVVPSLRELAFDGGSWEGPNYWNYQTVAATGLLSSLHAAHDGGGPPLPDLRLAGVYAFHSTDASDRTSPPVTASFADSGRERHRSTLPAWVAYRYSGPESVALAVEGQIRQGVELLWWPIAPDATTIEQPERRSTAFAHTALAVLHGGSATAWVKGQGPTGIHTHLDAGAVAYRRDGVDWSVDPGSGDYSLPGYFESREGGQRWTYLVTRPAGHSTVRVAGGLGQKVGARAPVAVLDQSTATVALRSVLPGTTAARRVVRMLEDGVQIEDLIEGRRQGYVWTWATEADARLDGDEVVLTHAGRTARLALQLPAGSRLLVVQTALTGPNQRMVRVISASVPATTKVRIVASLRVID